MPIGSAVGRDVLRQGEQCERDRTAIAVDEYVRRRVTVGSHLGKGIGRARSSWGPFAAGESQCFPTATTDDTGFTHGPPLRVVDHHLGRQWLSLIISLYV
jgi:hypothetical protein